MNTCLVKSGAIYLRGSLRISVGVLIGSKHLSATGHQMLANAKCQLAIGNAQKIIRQCSKRQTGTVSIQHNRAI